MRGARFHAIFQRQFAGDEALLALAQHRFAEAGLGAEFYPETPQELADTLRFRPAPPESYTVHLPRTLDMLDPRDREKICAFASAADGPATALVVHDQREGASRSREYAAAVRQLDARLQEDGHPPSPLVFIEYAAWLEPSAFVALHEGARELPRIGACIDIGHIGLFHCERAFRREHPGVEFWRLKAHTPELRLHVESLQAACRAALPGVLHMVAALGGIGKPLHFHLHDGHPSSTFSSAGVSDHLSFFQEIPIPFSHRGSYTLPTLFGPLGLQRIVAAARAALPDEMLSFTLEIHAPQGRQELGDYAPLFSHWPDTANAERMQHWIEVLLRNHRLLRDACA